MRLLTSSALSFALALLLAPVSSHAAVPGSGSQSPSPDTTWTETIIGGSQVEPGQWPDVAGVLYGDQLGCTGTLIAPSLVLTAGHCIDPSINKVVLNTTDTSDGGETIEVLQALAYPRWEETYDIGLLFLAKDSTTPPRIIAQGCALEFYGEGASVELVGYGATDVQGLEYGTKLRHATTSITDPDCVPGNGCNPAISPGGELIAGGAGVDSCYGDSGGPVYLHTDAGQYLIGVVSRSYGDTPTPCGYEGIYTRADSISSWIEEVGKVTLPMADCQSDNGVSVPSLPTEAPAELTDEHESGGCSTGGSTTGTWILIALVMFMWGHIKPSE